MPCLIVGLGNPGPEYQKTRHNVGYRVVDTLAERWASPRFSRKFNGELATISQIPSVPCQKALLLKPRTYMNRSGLAVQQACAFYRIDPTTNLIVVSDDLDLPPGQLRLRKGGGAGGHKGVLSIVEMLGTESFARVRVGIGRPASGVPEDYVLSKIPASESDCYQQAFLLAAEAIERILVAGMEAAMNQFNRRREPSEP